MSDTVAAPSYLDSVLPVDGLPEAPSDWAGIISPDYETGPVFTEAQLAEARNSPLMTGLGIDLTQPPPDFLAGTGLAPSHADFDFGQYSKAMAMQAPTQTPAVPDGALDSDLSNTQIVTGTHSPGATAATGTILGEIRHGESYGKPDGSDADYNAVSGMPKGKSGKDFSTAAVGAQYDPHVGAIGAYQLEPDNIKTTGIETDNWTNNMTPEVQDQLGGQLLKDKGFQDYLNGDIDEAAMANKITDVWAAFQKASGEGRYDKWGNNKAHITYDELIGKLRTAKTQFQNGQQPDLSAITFPH
jgi:hypothetical protein